MKKPKVIVIKTAMQLEELLERCGAEKVIGELAKGIRSILIVWNTFEIIQSWNLWNIWIDLWILEIIIILTLLLSW